MSSSTLAVMSAALAGSILLNLYLVLRAPASESRRDQRQHVVTNERDAPRGRAGEGGGEGLGKALAPRTRYVPVPVGSREDGSDVDDEDGEAVSDRVLACTLAERQASKAWREQRGTATELLKVALVDEAAHDQEVKKVVDHFAEELGLGDGEKADLRERYDKLRKRTARQALEALEDDPPDYQGFLEQAQGMFAAEDQLFEDMFGEEAAQWARQTAAERRAGILVIAASWAEVGWEQALAPVGAPAPE